VAASNYFWGGALIGTWGTLLTTLTLPSEAMLLSVSRTRKNFSASIASLLSKLSLRNSITYHRVPQLDSHIELTRECCLKRIMTLGLKYGQSCWS
jgi:hypothetical protein